MSSIKNEKYKKTFRDISTALVSEDQLLNSLDCSCYSKGRVVGLSILSVKPEGVSFLIPDAEKYCSRAQSQVRANGEKR